jgi:hypothetical protein
MPKHYLLIELNEEDGASFLELLDWGWDVSAQVRIGAMILDGKLIADSASRMNLLEGMDDEELARMLHRALELLSEDRYSIGDREIGRAIVARVRQELWDRGVDKSE